MRLIVFFLASSLSALSPILSLAHELTDEAHEPCPASYLSGFYVGSQYGLSFFEGNSHRSWGVFASYQLRALKTLFVGAQLGYNDNAHKILWDVETLLCLTYLFRKRVTFSLKPGFVFTRHRLRCLSEYHPAFTASVGLGVCQKFHPFLAYRGVFAYRCNSFHTPSLHAFLGGFEVRF